MFVVVTYDVADDRRRLRVMKMMKGYGAHVQESVFECDLKEGVYLQMVKRLQKVLDLEVDNVRFYYLCHADAQRIEQMGVTREVQVAREFAVV
jgi:CRISPR-associated protein Cas2